MITTTIFIVLLALAIIIMFFAAQTQNPGFAVISGIMFLLLGFAMFPTTAIPYAGGISYLNGTTMVEQCNCTLDRTESFLAKETITTNNYASYSNITMGLLLIFVAMICFSEAFGMRIKNEDD